MSVRRREIAFYPHHHLVETRRSDCSRNGHIPNAVLADFADDARERLHLAIMGVGLFDDPAAPSLVLGEVGLRFLHEVTYPGALTIGVGIARIGGSSMMEYSGFFRDGRCLVLGHCTMVRLGADRRPAVFTNEERHRAKAFLLED